MWKLPTTEQLEILERVKEREGIKHSSKCIAELTNKIKGNLQGPKVQKELNELRSRKSMSQGATALGMKGRQGV